MPANLDTHQLLAQLFPSAPPTTIIEVGSHYGHDTVKLRNAFPRARIIAFEPDPRNIYLAKHSQIHKVVEYVEAAVSDTDGTAVFHLSDGIPPGAPKAAAVTGWSQSSSLKKPDQVCKVFPWLKFERTSKVKTVRLDTYCKEHTVLSVDFLWADVQGAEDLLIAGAQETLKRTRYFFTEFSTDHLYQGDLDAQGILARLPNPAQWEVKALWPGDILLENTAFAEPPHVPVDTPEK